MYSKYQINKILGNCFRSMNYFFWIKLILVLIHFKYWYYNSPYAEHPYLLHQHCQLLPSPTETLSNTNLIMCSSSISIFLSYSIRPQATTSIVYTKSYVKPSQSNLLSSHKQMMIPYESNTLPIKKRVFKNRFSSKFIQNG